MESLYTAISNDISRLADLVRETSYLPEEAERRSMYLDDAAEEFGSHENPVDPENVLDEIRTLFRYYDELRVLFTGDRVRAASFRNVMASLDKHGDQLRKLLEG